MTVAEAQAALQQKGQQLAELLAQLAQLQQQAAAWAHQVEQLTRRWYGPRSEQYHPDQLLFDPLLIAALEQPVAAAAPPAEVPVKPHRRRVNGHGREALPAHLERVEILLDVPAAERVGPVTGEALVRIGEERTEKLACEPARLYVKVWVRPKYASAAKVHGSSGSGLVIAELPEFPLAKCKADTSLLAHVAVSKYVDYQPLYRQEDLLARAALALSRQTLDGWLMQLADAPLQPLYEALKAAVLARDVLFTDDTPVRVLVPGLGRTRQARLWVYRTGTGPPLVVYDYSPDRSQKWPLAFLSPYRGYLHADAYSGYDQVFLRKTISEVGCWVHARRYFDDAVSSAPGEATEMLGRIRGLYRLEHTARDLTDAARAALRQQQAKPQLEQIFQRAEEWRPTALPKSPLGQGVTYLLNQRVALQRYLKDGRLRPDNNLAENVIRPLALGRKNWLFLGSDRGGRAAALLFSLLQSCRLHGLNPQAYLQDVLDRILTQAATALRNCCLTTGSRPLPTERAVRAPQPRA